MKSFPGETINWDIKYGKVIDEADRNTLGINMKVSPGKVPHYNMIGALA